MEDTDGMVEDTDGMVDQQERCVNRRTFLLVPAYPGSPGQKGHKTGVSVCCIYLVC